MGTFFAELAIFFGVIIIGVKKSGSLGLISILGLAIYVFCFGVTPSSVPVNIAFLIFSIFIASSTLGACGGIDYLTYLSGKAIAKYPKMINLFAPLVSFIFVWLCGSGYVVAAILPMIYEIAKKSNIRPERPITASVIAANHAVVCSPISAPALALTSVLKIDSQIMFPILTISAICGVFCAAISVFNMGKDMKQEDFFHDKQNSDFDFLEKKFNIRTKISVLLFFLTVVAIAIFGIFENLRPTVVVDGGKVPMNTQILMEIMMLSLSAIIIFICGIKPSTIYNEQTFRVGGSVIMSVFGISWLAKTFFSCNESIIISLISSVVSEHVWTFAIFIFIISAFITSHTASILTLFPLGLILGVSPLSLLILVPFVNSVFILPSYPTIQAAIDIDRSGSTHVGKYVINHSFIRPGMVAVIVGFIVSYLLVTFFC